MFHASHKIASWPATFTPRLLPSTLQSQRVLRRLLLLARLTPSLGSSTFNRIPRTLGSVADGVGQAGRGVSDGLSEATDYILRSAFAL